MSDNVAKSLNQILELLHDSQDGYNESAGAIKDQQLKAIFTNLAILRDKMIKELENKAHQLNITHEKTGSMLAAGHRLFLDLKSLVTDGDPVAIINEIERGEKFTIKHYEDELEKQLPTDIKSIFQNQLNIIKNNLESILQKRQVAA